MSVLRQMVRPLAWTLVVTGLYAGVAVLLALAGGPTVSQAATTERVVNDRHTGLAIFGFDPVAYFVDRAPREGLGAHEFSWRGVVWRFANQGNLEAFQRDPEVYGPRLGGHDPVAVAEGAPTGGHPSIWLLHGERLYLFHSEANRRRFAAEPATLARAAEARWPRLASSLVGE